MMEARAMTASDRRFVVPTWALSSMYDDLRLSERFALVDHILDDLRADVVCLATGRTVHVWAAGHAGALDYVYVPPDLRGHGLARRAITALFGRYPERINVTHAWPREHARFRYTPHLLQRAAA